MREVNDSYAAAQAILRGKDDSLARIIKAAIRADNDRIAKANHLRNQARGSAELALRR